MLSLVAVMILAAPPGAQAPTLPVYLDMGKAPVPLAQRVEERIRAALEEHGVPIVADPGEPSGADGDPLSEAKRELDRGTKAYRELDLDVAATALRAAEERAAQTLSSAAVAAVVIEARVHLGLLALARGKTGEADEHFRRAASLDPERRLDGRLHPPEVVAAYEKARGAVSKGPVCELTLSAKPANAKVLVDGKPASGTVRLAYGVHYIQASTDLGSAGERVDLSQPRALSSLTLAPDAGTALASLRAAARRGDDAAAGVAADALAAASGAERVVLWDLRQQGGRVEAPMRLRDVRQGAFTWQVLADLGTAAAPEAAIRRAIEELLDQPAGVAVPITRKKPPDGSKSLPSWVWWAAGGVALAAAGGAAAFTLNGAAKNEDDEVVIVVEK